MIKDILKIDNNHLSPIICFTDNKSLYVIGFTPQKQLQTNVF